MENLKTTIKKVLDASGLEFSVEVDVDNNKVSLVLLDEELVKKLLPKLLVDLEQLIKVMAKRQGIEKISVDLNNYKKEREHLITELAKAAARKVLAEKKDVELPVMNAYERRLVHVELATRPDVKTESVGEGTDRHIIVRPL